MSPLPARDRLGEIAVKGVHQVRRELAVAPEQVAARRLARQAEHLAPPRVGAPRVLVLSPRSWAVHVQWEAMVGQALRLRGADVRFVTCGGGLEICDRANTWEAPPMPCRSCSHYTSTSLRAHGFEPLTLREAGSDAEVVWPELDELSLAELRAVTYGGTAVGELVDIPVKWFLMGADLDGDPLAPQTFRRFLRAARRVVDAMAAVLDQIEPDVVFLCNGLFFFEALCWALCRARGIDVVTYERGMIKETLVVSRNRAACLFDLDEQWATWAARPLPPAEAETLQAYLADRQQGRRTIDRFWGDARFEAPTRRGSGRLVSMFTNLTWDSAVIGQELAFAGIAQWVGAAVDAFAARPDDELVLRIHPAEVKLAGKQTREPIEALVRERYPVLPANVTLIGADDPTSSYPLMAASDAVLVFTSTTGLEAALAGVPVIVAGRTHYRGKGFTVDVSSPQEFVDRLDDVLAEPERFRPDADLAARYAYLFFFGAPVASPGVEEHLPGLARLTVRDLDELAPGHLAAMDQICDLILGPDAER